MFSTARSKMKGGKYIGGECSKAMSAWKSNKGGGMPAGVGKVLRKCQAQAEALRRGIQSPYRPKGGSTNLKVQVEEHRKTLGNSDAGRRAAEARVKIDARHTAQKDRAAKQGPHGPSIERQTKGGTSELARPVDKVSPASNKLVARPVSKLSPAINKPVARPAEKAIPVGNRPPLREQAAAARAAKGTRVERLTALKERSGVLAYKLADASRLTLGAGNRAREHKHHEEGTKIGAALSGELTKAAQQAKLRKVGADYRPGPFLAHGDSPAHPPRKPSPKLTPTAPPRSQTVFAQAASARAAKGTRIERLGKLRERSGVLAYKLADAARLTLGAGNRAREHKHHEEGTRIAAALSGELISAAQKAKMAAVAAAKDHPGHPPTAKGRATGIGVHNPHASK